MSRVSFDSTKLPLDEILKKARDGLLQLPDFQRGWVWDDEGLRSLLSSVSRSFPVGAIMTLQTGGDVKFKPRVIEGAPKENEKVVPDARDKGPGWLASPGTRTYPARRSAEPKCAAERSGLDPAYRGAGRNT